MRCCLHGCASNLIELIRRSWEWARALRSALPCQSPHPFCSAMPTASASSRGRRFASWSVVRRRSYSARWLRLIHGDEHPDGPGFRSVRVPSSVDGTYTGTRQLIAAGSYVRVPRRGGLASGQGPDRAGVDLAHDAEQSQAGRQSSPRSPAFVFGLDADGRLRLDLGAASVHGTRGARPLALDVRGGELRQANTRRASVPGQRRSRTRHTSSQCTRPGSGRRHPRGAADGDVLIAARELDAQRRPQAVFNGKIERPKLFDRALEVHEIEGLREVSRGRCRRGVLAAWDFAADIGGAESKIARATAAMAKPSTCRRGR